MRKGVNDAYSHFRKHDYKSCLRVLNEQFVWTVLSLMIVGRIESVSILSNQAVAAFLDSNSTDYDSLYAALSNQYSKVKVSCCGMVMM